ncbi:hypothetical protein IVB69_11290 [Flavobacterium sp. J49]|uniref:hypothetical protein n=1 Tax=Flavobacterium sp. J49 TaxID=2718534 RepID=UPI00159453B3|nr:hypothetical protein [Flavobacterium sp. J49]MBF6642066.1 hypothetical protein [Flavobacterium sp. J49]NIC03314.1 hypothetical protein [Flavobacterium sp. J49]
MNPKVYSILLLFFVTFDVTSQNDSIRAAKKVLDESDLPIIAYLTENDSTTYYHEDDSLTKYFRFELIDEKLYLAKKKKAVSFLTADTLAHKKTKGIITLPCQKKTVTFTDLPSEEETNRIYEYVGQINLLNAYVVYGMYWEDYDFTLIDKTSGETTASFVDYPNISTDKKTILCLGANVYENTADLDFFVIDNKKILQKMNAVFKYWMPAGEITDMFWSTDGYFYLPVVTTSHYWKPDGSLNDQWQYLRIKPIP